jgi:zinc protease
MFRRVLPTALFLGFVAAGAPARAAPLPSLPVEEHHLANGMTVLLAPDPSLDDVTVLVRYAVGTADNPENKDGLAHVVEHLMFAGSKHVPGGHARLIERTGGWNLNATTTLDDTLYFVTVPPEQIPVVFWLESDRMGFLADRVDQASVARELALVADEAREKVDDRTLGAVGETGLGEVFPEWHPYHRQFAADSIGKLSLADVRAFLRTWYTPRNATLVVTGRFEPSAVLALAAQYFGDLPAEDPPARPRLPAPNAPDVHVEMKAGVSRDFVTLLWPAPALHEPGDAELDMAAAILADPDGRFQKELVASGLAVRVSAHEHSFRRGSAFVVSVIVADGRSADYVGRVAARIVRDLARGVTQEECDRVRAEWRDTTLLRLETSLGRATYLAIAGERDRWTLATYENIGPAAVQQALQAMLARSQAVVVVHQDVHFRPQGVVVDRRVEAR